jgi:hypothetical protein
MAGDHLVLTAGRSLRISRLPSPIDDHSQPILAASGAFDLIQEVSFN